MNQLTLQSEMATTVNVGEMVDDIMRFIKNDSASKSITFRAESAADVFVLAQAHKFRMLILGLSSALTDGLAPGTVVDIAVARAGSSALVEFRSVMPCSSVPTPEDLRQTDNSGTSLFELVVALMGRWTALNGGRIDFSTEPHLPTVLRIYYPLASSEQGSHDHGTGAIDTAVEGSVHRG